MKDRLSRIGRACALFAMAFVFAAFAAGTAFFCGCTTGNDGIYIDETIWVYATNRIDHAIEKHSPAPDAATGDDSAEEGQSGSVGAPSDGGKPSGVGDSSLKLDFRYGGFKGGNAKEDSRCRIGSPKITKDKISWKWETKIPSDWKRGSTSKGPMVISAAFYWDESEKKWIGGKMDWCDEARTSRATGHIYDGYNGWKSAGWDKAKKRGFCVVSADGKYRSNFIED